MIASCIEDLGIVTAQDEWSLPIETICATLRWSRTNETLLACSQIASTHRSVLAFRVDLIRIGWIDQANETVATTNVHPIAVYRSAVIANHRWSTPATVILQPP